MRAKKQRQPLQRATVIKTAQVKPKDSLGSLDRGVLIKIQKCLSRARHKSTTEPEAKAALFVAQKLMAQYNVSQADLVANSDYGSKAQYGGMSKVEITNVKNRTRRVINEAFVHKLAKAMSAIAFEMAHNKILDWACSYKGGSATFSYRVGVADGLVSMANREKKIELEAARKKELDIIAAKEREADMERERKPQRLYKGPSLALDIDGQSEDEIPGFLDIDSMSDGSYGSLESIDNLNLNTSGALVDFNENDENVVDLTCSEDNIDKIIKRESRETRDFNSTPSPPVKQNPSDKNSSFVKSEDMSNSPWMSETQLKHNIKLRMGKARTVVTRDYSAYREGWKDSENIEFRRRRLG
ncbi:hypothetical protein BDV37DRAFT_277244 [Aspergillus pseudonomiae]|uniref:DUF2786 domain-containing protein n=1 Tax=Aspergillus pseudonomiae TaxID=1506151 RepID=A0A5N7CS87_9EURO|nr:uncharacterized protein BDV37DRAFT_277244 [Aspergillus pseudonomiae]KAE8397005.1 hypothetical protein BDV37DRAFT_277244 [Aspergillus pseudonomiae]